MQALSQLSYGPVVWVELIRPDSDGSRRILPDRTIGKESGDSRGRSVRRLRYQPRVRVSSAVGKGSEPLRSSGEANRVKNSRIRPIRSIR